MKSIIKVTSFIAVLSLITACSTWNGMSNREKGTVIGTGAGAVTGAAVTGGTVLGTGAGAALGGFIGNEVGKAL